MTKKTICCISDTHTYHHNLLIKPCDFIVHAGDFTSYGRMKEVIDFLDWYSKVPAEFKILICGNHEVEIGEFIPLLTAMCKERGITYMHNEAIDLGGVSFFGSPNSPPFGQGWAFNSVEKRLALIYDSIPTHTQVLITHGPPHAILDCTLDGDNAGSVALYNRLKALPKLELLVCGHIHEARGRHDDFESGLQIVNACVCGIPYEKLNLKVHCYEIEVES